MKSRRPTVFREVTRMLSRMTRALFSKFAAFDFAIAEHQIRAGVTLRKGHHYKYKSLCTSPIEQVIEILRDSKIYFPRPSQLNDKDEGKPQLVIGDISDPTYWPRVEAWVRRCISHRAQITSEEQIQTELAQLTQSMLEQMASQADADFKSEVEKRYRILSFGGSPLNRHLWDEYASCFNGVCIEFEVDSQFGSVYAVTYSDAPRRLDLTSIDDFEHLRLTVLVKGVRWSDEKEARMIFGEPPIDAFQPVLVDQRYAFPSDRLTGLFIGYKVSPMQREELLVLARARSRPIRCYMVWPIPWGTCVWLRRLL